jgi:hypothetical protein
MVSEEVAVQCKGVLCLRLLHHVAVVGKEKPVAVYEVMGVEPVDGSESFPTPAHTPEHTKLEGPSSNGLSPTGSRRESLLNTSISERDGEWKKEYVAANSANIEDLVALAHETTGCVTTKIQRTFATMHTEAVRLYLQQDFVGAIEKFNNMDSATRNEFTDHVSVERMVKECEQNIMKPPVHFTGVFTAHEK